MTRIDRVSDGARAWQFDMYVGAEVDGDATPEQLAVLEADPLAWRAALARAAARRRGASRERAARCGRRARAGHRRPRVGAPPPRRRVDAPHRPAGAARARTVATTHDDDRRRRAARAGHGRSSRCRGNRDASSRGRPARARRSRRADDVTAMLAAAGAPSSGWTRHAPVPLPGAGHADALAIPVGDVLGWLVAAGADQVGDDIGAERALAGPRRDLGGRAHRARRDGSAAAPAQARRAAAPTTRTARTRCAGRPRSSTPPASPRPSRRCPASLLRARPEASTPAR